MRKRHDQTAPLHPLHLTRRDELIDDTLRIVCKITELSLPDNQSIGRRERVAVFETEDTELAQGGVGNHELCLVLRDVLQRGIGLLVLLVVENGMSLGEGTTLNILTRYTDMVTLSDQRTEGQGFSSRPVDVLAFGDGLNTVCQDTL